MRSQDREQFEARVKEALSSLEPITMSDAERARLRQAVWTELRSGAPERVPARIPWRARIAGAAAVVAVVAGGLYAGGVLGSGSPDAGLTALGGGEEERSGTTFAIAAETHSSGGDTAATSSSDAEDGDLQTLGTNDAVEVAPPSLQQRLSREAEKILLDGEVRATGSGDTSCQDSPGLEGHELVSEVEVDGTVYQAWAPRGQRSGGEQADLSLTFVDPADCSVVLHFGIAPGE
ncbi:MAG: hypothetical protein DIU67_001385 [Actinomycetes bacterium]|jgi:hypothetical protein|nr:MAG: hypothetical protein DIU67_01055 [Actinomycetota bacterium]